MDWKLTFGKGAVVVGFFGWVGCVGAYDGGAEGVGAEDFVDKVELGFFASC